MDLALSSAARALAAGDVLEALKRVALRTDAPALALRGVALARLGDLPRARELLGTAAKAFGARSLGRARCLLADAEIALFTRDIAGVEPRLVSVAEQLAAFGDHANAGHAQCLLARSLLLRGRTGEARVVLAGLELRGAPALLEAEVALAHAELAFRTLDPRAARVALARAERAANKAKIPALSREVAAAQALFEAPAARAIQQSGERSLKLADLEVLLRKQRVLFVDALDQTVHAGRVHVSLARRPVLFALGRVLGSAWPGAAAREALIASAFAVTRPNESHRARLRVEIGRLRRALRELAEINATPGGFRLELRAAIDVVVLARPGDDEHAPLLALLGDGEAWASSALAAALGQSQRSVQRALSSLEHAGKVHFLGRARAKRWLVTARVPFATPLLLPSSLTLA